jgi:hypothetical protein
MSMDTVLEVKKPWYLRQFVHASINGILAVAFAGLLLYRLGNSRQAFWFELLKLVGLVGFFIQRIVIARKHPALSWYIYDGFSWAAIFSTLTDVAWATQLGH